MSYSSETKEELCRYEPDSVCCLLAELSGIISVAGSVILRGGGEKRLSIETENNAVARTASRSRAMRRPSCWKAAGSRCCKGARFPRR